MKLRRILSDRKLIFNIYSGLACFCCVLGLVLQAHRSLTSAFPIPYFLVNFIYFTTQSNILVLTVLISHFTRLNNSAFHSVLAHISLANIIITAVVFHLFLGPYMTLSIVQHMLHTVTPILYLTYYFLSQIPYLKLHRVWVFSIYPTLYSLLIYALIHPLFSDTLRMVQGDFQGASYVYPFYDPYFYDFQFWRMLLFFSLSIILMTFIIYFLTQPLKKYAYNKEELTLLD